jgi:hypothetical protein
MKEKSININTVDELDIPEKPLRFVLLHAAKYRMYASKVCSAEAAGLLFQDLLDSILDNNDPNYEENKKTVKEAYAYIKQATKKRKEGAQKWRLKILGEKDEKKNEREKPDILENWKDLERHELQKIMTADGISENDFFRWYEDSCNNDWLDKYGKNIRNPIAACRAYSKQMQPNPEEK